MQRRRLSRFARLALAAAWPLATGPMPLVFVSRHGETERAETLLDTIAAAEPVSPTQFSLSVHNAFIGLWSILRKDRSEMTALAAEGDGLEHGLLEAAALLQEGVPAVLVVVAEDRPADSFAAWIDDVPYPYALALRITAGSEWQLSLQPRRAGSEPAALPHALSLGAALATTTPHFEHHWKARTWTWQRLP